jgi:FAD/FMN-containing dehydrogenase
MGEYTNGIERINIELSLRNKLQLLDALELFFMRGNLPLGKSDDAGEIPSAELLEDRVQQALQLLREVRALWQQWYSQLDTPQPEGRTFFELLQDGTLRASWKQQVLKSLQTLFAGAAFAPILAECRRIHREVLRGRVWVALHMHAGDGNVHTNIPVNSDNSMGSSPASTASASPSWSSCAMTRSPPSPSTSGASTRRGDSTRASCCAT